MALSVIAQDDGDLTLNRGFCRFDDLLRSYFSEQWQEYSSLDEAFSELTELSAASPDMQALLAVGFIDAVGWVKDSENWAGWFETNEPRNPTSNLVNSFAMALRFRDAVLDDRNLFKDSDSANAYIEFYEDLFASPELDFRKRIFLAECLPVSYTHLTLPTIYSV